jgi:predicted phosphodiesterase
MAMMAAVSLLPALSTQAAEAGAKAAAPEKPLRIVWGPFLQNLTTTGASVIWCPGQTSEGVVEYGQAADKLDKSVRPAENTGRAAITGLAPGKTYFYRVTVKSEDGKSTFGEDVASFKTPVEGVKTFSFAVIADTHTAGCNKDLASLMGELKPDFVLNGGDRSPSVMSGTLKPYHEIMARVPMYMARGNHDGADKQKMVSDVPGPGDNQYFAFTWGNARIISVNTEDRKGNPAPLKKGGAQYQWLEDELKNCKETWKIVFQHIPVYSAYSGGLTDDLDDERALLEQYGADLVFQGHQHNYDRSLPLNNKAVAKDGHGVIYVTCSGACGGYEKFPKGTDLWFLAKTYNAGPFLGMVYIDGKKLKMNIVGPDKKEIDSLELRKP